MTTSMRNKCKRSIFSCFMAFLFAGGLVLSGSDFVGFPYGQLIGVPMLVLFAFIGRRLEREHAA